MGMRKKPNRQAERAAMAREKKSNSYMITVTLSPLRGCLLVCLSSAHKTRLLNYHSYSENVDNLNGMAKNECVIVSN